MALQVWLPLNGNLNNQGLANVSVTNNGATVDSAGKIGSCYSFDGINDYITTGNTTLTVNMSFACWIMFTGSGAYHIIDCRDSSGNGYQPFYGGVNYGLQTHNSNGGQSLNISSADCGFTINKWYHIACTYSSTDIKIYIDGILKGSLSGGGTAFISKPLKIGCCATNVNWFNGKLNDIRIYDHCLSPKEVKEISKGLVLHYKLDDAYIEATTNIASSLTPQANVGDWGRMTATNIGTNAYHLKHTYGSSSNPSYWSTFVYTLPSDYANKTISFSVKLKNIQTTDLNLSTSWIFVGQGNDGTYPTHGSVTKYYSQLTEYMIISWTGTLSNSHRYLVIELWNNDTSTSGKIEFDLFDIQIEKKDHATLYTPSYRGIQTQYDKTLYQESDGSLWVRIAHHNNPVNGNLFSQSDSFSTGVYKDADRWFDVYPTIRSMSKYEFMVKQKTTSSASEVKYRWIQNTSPLTAVYSNVAPNAVTRVTTTGYTDGGYGGLYILNSSTYMCIANTGNGNWFGAFGSWSSYSGGIPGYPNTAITSGYMDLYARVDGIAFPVYDCSGYERNGLFSGGISTQASEARYNICTKFNGSDTRIEVPFKYSNYGDNFTICAWVKSNVNSGGYLTAVGNELGTGGVVFAELGATNKLNCYLNGTSGADINVCSYNSFAANQWYHVVYSVQSALSSPVATLYINGVSVSTKSGTSAFGEPNEPVYIGCNRNYRYWNGNISDFRIYTTVLSADDIKDLYQTSASIHNTGTIDAFEFEEGTGNIAIGAEAARSAKTWADGLSSYTQSNCSCTLTDDGYRIYRPANKTVSGDGNTMWGGFVLDNGENNRFNFQKGHTYMLQFEVKGKTSNAVSNIYWVNWVGWGGGGLLPSPSNVELCNPVTSNYNNSEWRTFTYKWIINDDVYKVCTSGYGGRYTTGNTYMSYTGFKYGFSYTDTGSLGTELYIRNIRMFDITNGQISQIEKTGIVDFSCFTEEGEIAEITPGGMVGKQIIEI